LLRRETQVHRPDVRELENFAGAHMVCAAGITGFLRVGSNRQQTQDPRRNGK
jgi:hypothetical protein